MKSSAYSGAPSLLQLLFCLSSFQNQLLAPAGEQQVHIVRDGFECTREFLVLLCTFDGVGTSLPAFVMPDAVKWRQ